jgi:hypothetical protein
MMDDEKPTTEQSESPALRPEIVDTAAGTPVTEGVSGRTVVAADGTEATPQVGEESEAGGPESESIEKPAKLLRIGSMVKQLLEEVRQAPLDEASRGRLKEIYEQSIRELAEGLSPDLAAELDRISIPFDSPIPSDAELRVAHAQLVGWLEGLFHGIQATLVAQQVAARAQLDEMRQRSLPQGPPQDVGRPGTYL